ncbi:MAG TPA: hypothetical protein P5572_16595 [Phycisphaerae bacterium]|nr:hypothetical protein [Phycisphaerales bacterium]HRX86644.1 hypothetical protein [Phycisphaerae bacterium]
MAATLRDRSAPALRWWVQRNPAYVLSAACIACGARLLLVPEHKLPAGDLAVILATLGVLQAYEMGVTTIMLFLQRKRRAPEDQPSLFIIEAIFWTGPLVATMEMAALDRRLGTMLALAAALIAIGELQALTRYFRWRLAWSTHAVAAGCVVLVAIAQPLLHVADPQAGTNEVLLYALWWLVAALLLAAVPGLRKAHAVRVDVGVIAAAVGAALLHLVAMNHAFFGHARWFYAAAPLAAVSAAGLLTLQPARGGRSESLLALFFWIPFVGIFLSFNRFDPVFPLARLPLPLRDPLFVSLALAAVAWGCGYVRHRLGFLLHAAVLAAAYAGERLYFSGALAGAPGGAGPSLETLLPAQRGVILLTAGLYFGVLALRHRVREGVVAALFVTQFGVASVVPSSWPAVGLIVCATWGWTVLLVMHVAVERARLLTRLLPIVFLFGVSVVYAQQPAIASYALAHGVFLVVVLGVVGWLRPWTSYRIVAVGIGALGVFPYTVRWAQRTTHGWALLMISAGFLLLAVGLLISWNKSALLAMLPVRIPLEVATEEEVKPANPTGLP